MVDKSALKAADTERGTILGELGIPHELAARWAFMASRVGVEEPTLFRVLNVRPGMVMYDVERVYDMVDGAMCNL